MNSTEIIDRVLAYIKSWRYFRKFTSRATLESLLGSDTKKASAFMKVCDDLNLARRQNKKANQSGGLVWNESEVRPLMNK